METFSRSTVGFAPGIRNGTFFKKSGNIKLKLYNTIITFYSRNNIVIGSRVVVVSNIVYTRFQLYRISSLFSSIFPILITHSSKQHSVCSHIWFDEVAELAATAFTLNIRREPKPLPLASEPTKLPLCGEAPESPLCERGCSRWRGSAGHPGTQLGGKRGTEVCPLLSPLELILPDHITHSVGPEEPRRTLEGARNHIWDEGWAETQSSPCYSMLPLPHGPPCAPQSERLPQQFL